MSAQDDLWADLHDLFDTDDGSLPEIVLRNPPRSALQPLLAFLMQRGTVSGTLWDATLGANLPIADAPDANERIATGRIAGLHAAFTGIDVDGIQIPQLGAFYAEDEVALDYRMGDDWTPPVLAAFVRLLDAMRALAPGTELQARPETGQPPDPRFAQALERYISATSSR